MDKKIVMVVDDTQIIRNIISKALGEEYYIVEAENGDDAINKLQMLNYGISGMFLDLIMPVSDGYKVLDELKRLNIKLPITVISGDDSTETITKVCNEYGVNYISKPLSMDKIKATADNMCK